MTFDVKRTINALDLGRRGAAAAMLPGLLPIFVGWPGYLLGALATIAIVALSVSMRAGLAFLAWYRIYFGLIFAGTCIMSLLVTLRPEHKPLIVTVYVICSVVVAVAYVPFWMRVHGKPISELRGGSPPTS